jgi:hypothetical protein
MVKITSEKGPWCAMDRCTKLTIDYRPTYAQQQAPCTIRKNASNLNKKKPTQHPLVGLWCFE